MHVRRATEYSSSPILLAKVEELRRVTEELARLQAVLKTIRQGHGHPHAHVAHNGHPIATFAPPPSSLHNPSPQFVQQGYPTTPGNLPNYYIAKASSPPDNTATTTTTQATNNLRTHSLGVPRNILRHQSLPTPNSFHENRSSSPSPSNFSVASSKVPDLPPEKSNNKAFEEAFEKEKQKSKKKKKERQASPESFRIRNCIEGGGDDSSYDLNFALDEEKDRMDDDDLYGREEEERDDEDNETVFTDESRWVPEDSVAKTWEASQIHTSAL